MTDHLSESGAAIEMWIKCPYDKSHLLIKEDLLEHLEACRDKYMKTAAAEGRSLTRVYCNKTRDHLVPELELYLHRITCPDVSSEDEFVKSGVEVTKQEADSSSGSFLDFQEREPEGAAGLNSDDFVDWDDEDDDWAAICAANAAAK